MKNGTKVAEFEREFAAYVGAKYAIALCNGTATLHTALVALGVKPGDRVAVPPLTMSATTIAVLQAGAVPVFADVHSGTWVMNNSIHTLPRCAAFVPVSLYGLHQPYSGGRAVIDDAAQTLRPHSGCAFTSYSFQASKILALGEGGMLVTNDEALATRAREFSSLGYRMRADQPRIDPAALKSPDYARHYSLGYNYRMSDLVAAEGLKRLTTVSSTGHQIGFPSGADELLALRRRAAAYYRDAIAGCDWLTPQHVPEGWTHDYWTYAVAITPSRDDPFETGREIDDGEQWQILADMIVRHCGERPYAAWRLTYQEPAFNYLWTAALSKRPYADGRLCPVAEDLQPRLMQFQTNNLASAERNATALAAAIREVGG